jgi:hypothetical protein
LVIRSIKVTEGHIIVSDYFRALVKFSEPAALIGRNLSHPQRETAYIWSRGLDLLRVRANLYVPLHILQLNKSEKELLFYA